MGKTTTTKEVILTCPNQVGTLARVTTTLAEAKINIEACTGYTDGGNKATLHLVTSDPTKTTELCRKSGWNTQENTVVCCELTNKVGTLADTTTKLSQAGIDINYCYTSTGNGSTTKAYFSTKDNTKATKVLG